MAEAQLAAQELVIGVLQPARAQHLVRQVVHVLQDEEARHQPGREARLARTRRADAGKAPIEKNPQSISRANRTSGSPRSMIASSAGRNRSFWRSSRGFATASPNADDPLPNRRRDRSWLGRPATESRRALPE